MTVRLPKTAVMARNAKDTASLMTRRTAELLVIGDPGCEGWRYLERETACRVRLLADSRGGLLAALLEAVGPRRFAQCLAELGDAALINTRVLFRDTDFPAEEDFMQSDRGCPSRIAHEGLRQLTEALLAHGKPVILGGDSLMRRDIYRLVKQAWKDQELARQFNVVAS